MAVRSIASGSDYSPTYLMRLLYTTNGQPVLPHHSE